ncbi:MAG: hypothetical protein DCC67_01785 [Planctomycetota bacterium]|nr:MAG: hypothetical protein DCC67_01785 [Planctomycetota bacterium]
MGNAVLDVAQTLEMFNVTGMRLAGGFVRRHGLGANERVRSSGPRGDVGQVAAGALNYLVEMLPTVLCHRKAVHGCGAVGEEVFEFATVAASAGDFGFSANVDETKKTWDEWVRILPKMWTQERFSYQGRAFSMPERAIIPKPVQKPHPPMWVAVTSPGTELDAADRGMGSLGLTFGGFREQEAKIKEYRRRIKVCEPAGAFVNEQVNTVNFLFCHEDLKYGVKTGQRLSGTFNYLAAQLLPAREAMPRARSARARP